MSYETNLTTTITFCRETYNHRWQVEDKLTEVRTEIADLKSRLIELAVMTEPQKFFTDAEDGYVLEEVRSKAKYYLECLDEYSTEEYKLVKLLESWEECHDKEGFAIPCPDEHFGKSYLDGDFVKQKEDKE